MNSPNVFQQTHQRREGVFAFITVLARACGFVTLGGLVLLSYAEWSRAGGSYSCIYLAMMTIVVGYLELLWIFDKFVTCCICCFRSERCFFWVCCVPVDNWVRTLIYTGFSLILTIPSWLQSGFRTDVSVVGLLLIITGLLYFIRTFKYKAIAGAGKYDETNSFYQSSISGPTSITKIDSISRSSEFSTAHDANTKQ